MDVIKSGDYVIVQRQAYTKLFKVKEKGTLNIGNFVIEADNVINEKFYTTFRMVPKPNSNKLYLLEKVEQLNTIERLNIEESGFDNRNITDDGKSQSLTSQEIDRLKTEELSSASIVEKLISSSKTFNSKTEYSQEKYIKKKEKKYFEYIQLKKPSIRLLAQMFYRQDSQKILELRMDYISQILSFANIQSTGNHLLYDSGTLGLMTATILNRIGPNTDGRLIHVHPGNECQRNTVLAMQFPKEQLDRCINVNLYSVLRCFYQEKESYQSKAVEMNKQADETETAIEEVIERENESEEIPTKKIKLDPQLEKKKWQLDNEKACRMLEGKVDSIVITCKEHPLSIVKEFIQFLGASRSIVVYHTLREPLEEVFLYLKNSCECISLKLIDNFMRNYQVLPERTHPEVNMTVGGYFLTGFKLN